MTREDTERRSQELIEPILHELGFELWDVEYVKEAGEYYLRAYIDKPGGITINDCEAVSRRFSDSLDREDFIPESYILEVSSPGLGRALKKDRDFERSLGEDVEVKTYAPKKFDSYSKARKEYSGCLEAYDGGTVTIRDEDGSELVFQRSEIALIRLAVYF